MSPKAPDPYATADAQGQANKDAAVAQQQLSMVNQYSPYGSLTYEQTGTYSDGTPRFSAYQKLSDNQQQISDTAEKTALGLGQQYYDRYVGGGGPQEGGRAYDAIIERAQPQFDQQYDRMQTMLANRGITDPTSEAYKRAIDEHNRGYNDFLLGAGERRYAIDADERTRALNELLGISSGSQITSPYVNTPQSQGVGAAPIADSIYANYNAANQNAAGNRGGAL